MSLFSFFKRLFGPTEQEVVQKNPKTLQDLDFLDDVWVKDKYGNILKGWVFDINKKHVFVIIPSEEKISTPENQLDFRFIITRPLTQTQLTQNGITLFLNKPC